jgi:RNA polymerase sigma-70 factor (ECF subfamily)
MATVKMADFGGPSDRSGLSTIIDAARNGGAEALNRLLKVAHVYCGLLAVDEVSAALKRRFDESDVRQESLLDVARGIRRFNGGSREFFGWLRQIVRTNAVDQHRRHGRAAGREVLHDLDLHEVPALTSGDLLRFEERELVEKAMSKLSRDQQTVLRLRVWDGLKWDEVGERMNRPANAARQLFVRAIYAVRERLGDEAVPSARRV